MKFIYEIADLRILCEPPFEINILDESKEFIYEFIGEETDLRLCFQQTDEIIPPEQYHSQANKLFCGEKTYFLPAPGKSPYACVTRSEGEICCEYLCGYESNLNFSHNICEIIQLETLLNEHNGILLHSAVVRWNGKSVLLAAPSGTGKSTQAALWEKYEGAEIINGDRSGLRRIDGEWMSYGLPYAGSSRIYRNERVSVGAIAVLRQAKENTIRKLSPAEAVKYLYPEVSAHRWDSSFVNKTLDYLIQLVTDVPVFLLSCLPDAEAVELLKSEIEKEWE